MKRITDFPVNTQVTIAKLHANGPLKQRFMSLGIMKGSIVTILAYSATHSTVEIKVGKMQLALRKEEAETIEVMA